jgi:hypothetical protein
MLSKFSIQMSKILDSGDQDSHAGVKIDTTQGTLPGTAIKKRPDQALQK